MLLLFNSPLIQQHLQVKMEVVYHTTIHHIPYLVKVSQKDRELFKLIDEIIAILRYPDWAMGKWPVSSAPVDIQHKQLHLRVFFHLLLLFDGQHAIINPFNNLFHFFYILFKFNPTEVIDLP